MNVFQSTKPNSIGLILKNSLQSLLLALALVPMVLPVSTLAQSRSNIAVQGGEVNYDLSTVVSMMDTNSLGDQQLVNDARARWEAVGRDPSVAFLDPYYIYDQTITIEQDGDELGTYDLFEPNEDAITPPLTYNLRRDVEATVDGDLLILELSKLNGRPLKNGTTFTHRFKIHGIQSVYKDAQHIHLLLKNGDVLTIFMGHQWLFNPNLPAGGGALATFFIHALPKSFNDAQTKLINSELALRSYDARKFNDFDFSEVEYEAVDGGGVPAGKFSTLQIRSLLYGDILIGEQDASTGKFVVRDIMFYRDVVEGLEANYGAMDERMLQVQGEATSLNAGWAAMSSTLAAMDSESELVREIQARTGGELGSLRAFEQRRHLAQLAPSNAADWKEVPWEARKFTSTRMEQADLFVKASRAMVENPRTRVTYERDLEVAEAPESRGLFGSAYAVGRWVVGRVPATVMWGVNRLRSPEPMERQPEGTLEAEIQELNDRATSEIRGTRSIVRAGLTSEQWNNMLRNLTGLGLLVVKAGSVFVKTKAGLVFTGVVLGTAGGATLLEIFNGTAGDRSVASLLMENIGLMGDMAWNSFMSMIPEKYSGTRWAFTAENLATHKSMLWNLPGTKLDGPEVLYGLKVLFWSGVSIAGIYSAARIFALGDQLVLGRRMAKDAVTGLTVYYTVCQRLMARMLYSWRSLAGKAADKVTGGRHNFEGRLDATRMGIAPEDYRNMQDLELDAYAQQEKVQQVLIISNRITLTMMLAALLRDHRDLFSAGENLSLELVKERLGERAFKNFAKRAALTSGRIYNFLLRESSTQLDLLSKEQIEVLEKEIYDEIGDTTAGRVTISRGLYPEERVELAKLERQRGAKFKWAVLAGNNHLYHKNKTGEVPENVITEALGWNSFIDFMTMVPFTAITPAFADLRPDKIGDLAMGDNWAITGGTMSPFLISELLLNVGHWASNTPMEIIVWAKAAAGKTVDDYVNPELLVLESQIENNLRRAAPARIDQSAEAYARGYTGMGFFHGFEKLGDRITKGHFKTLKATLIVDVIVTILGYGMALMSSDAGALLGDGWAASLPGLREGLGSMIDVNAALIWLSFKRVLLITAWAYLSYRIGWMWHNLGLVQMNGRVLEEMRLLKSQLLGLGREIVFLKRDQDLGPETQIQHKEKILNRLKEIQVFFARHGKEIPEDLNLAGRTIDDFDTASLLELAESTLIYAQKNPPTSMRPNMLVKHVVTWGMGIATTVVGLIGFAYSWRIAEDMPVQHIVGLVGLAYVVGLVSLAGGRYMRAKKGFRPLMRDLAAFMHTNPQSIDERQREKLVLLIEKAEELYKTFDSSLPKSVVDRVQFNPNDASMVLETAKKLYEHMKEKPPADPSKFGFKVVKRDVARFTDPVNGAKACRKNLRRAWYNPLTWFRRSETAIPALVAP